MKKPIALLTGATGFIGSHLAEHLLDKGWKVHIIVRPHSNLKAVPHIKKKLHIHSVDGSFNSLDKVVRQSKPDVVFHLASLFLAQHDSEDIDPLFQSNLAFPAKLVEAMIKNKVYRLINVGTAWQHYQGKEYSPVCLYAATKQAFEAILSYFVESTPLKVSTIKLYDTYGPRDLRKKLFAVMLQGLKKKISLSMSPGKQKIDLVYIDDVVNGLRLAAERQLRGKSGKWEIFTINTRKPDTLKNVITLFEKVAGQKLSIKWGERPYRPREVMSPWKGTSWVPGWKPKTDLKTGLKKMIAAS